MSIGEILYSIYLACISIFVLEVLCLECTAMYLANAILFVFLFAALGMPVGCAARFIRDYALAVLGKPSNLDFKPRLLRHAIAIGIVFLLSWLIMLALSAEKGRGEDAASVGEKLSAFYMQSLHDIEVNPAWAVSGNPDAKVTIVDELSTGTRGNLDSLGGGVEFVPGDLGDMLSSHKVNPADYDIIFHLAANAYIPPSVEDPGFDGVET